MISETIKYFIKMPWNIIRTDIKKYNDIRQKYFSLKKKSREAYKSLINDVGEIEGLGVPDCPGCIVTWVRVTIDPRDGDTIPHFHSEDCEHFSENEPCNKKDCLYYSKNQNYFRAVKEMNNFKQQKDKYWRESLFIVK